MWQSSGWPILLPFPVVLPQSRGRTDEVMRITIPHEGFHEVVLLLPEVLSLLCKASGMVVKTPYRILLHMCWMMRSKVQVPVHVRPLTVYSNAKFTILLPCYPRIKEGDITVGEDELLVSFNVSLLFTNVPIGEAVQVIQAKLMEDDSLAESSHQIG